MCFVLPYGHTWGLGKESTGACESAPRKSGCVAPRAHRKQSARQPQSLPRDIGSGFRLGLQRPRHQAETLRRVISSILTAKQSTAVNDFAQTCTTSRDTCVRGDPRGGVYPLE